MFFLYFIERSNLIMPLNFISKAYKSIFLFQSLNLCQNIIVNYYTLINYCINNFFTSVSNTQYVFVNGRSIIDVTVCCI